MKYVFFGTPEFAAIVLGKLINAGMPPVVLVCNPDRPVGRKQVITSPPTKQLVLEKSPSAKILQPSDKGELVDLSQELSAEVDLAVVAAYSMIIPQEIIKSFRLGVAGVHPSLLPQYRGSTPIQSVILAGEEQTGTTLFVLDSKMDHGPVLAQSEVQVSDMNYGELMKKLAMASGELLVGLLPAFTEGKVEPREQDHSEATYTKMFKTEDAYVSLENLEQALGGDEGQAERILRMIRALNPEPGVHTVMDGTRTKLLRAEIDGGQLVLKEIQKAGRKPERAA